MNVPDSKINFAFTRKNVSLSLGHFKTKIQIKLEFSLNIASGQKKKYPGKIEKMSGQKRKKCPGKKYSSDFHTFQIDSNFDHKKPQRQ